MRQIRGYPQERSLKKECRPPASCLLYNCRKSPREGGGKEREGEPRTKWRRPFFFSPSSHPPQTYHAPNVQAKGRASPLKALYKSPGTKTRLVTPLHSHWIQGRRGGEAVIPRVNSAPPPAPPTKRKSYECNFKSLVVYFFFSFTPMPFLSFIILFVGTFFHCFSTLRPGKEQSGDFSHCRRYEKRARLHGIAFRRD